MYIFDCIYKFFNITNCIYCIVFIYFQFFLLLRNNCFHCIGPVDMERNKCFLSVMSFKNKRKSY